MGKKGGPKKDPNGPIIIPEDTINRVVKLKTLNVQMKPPKPGTFLTNEEWCIPPFIHPMPEFKQSVLFWQQCATVRYNEKDAMKAPTRMKEVEDASKTPKKPAPTRKEVTDLSKYLKTLCKQSKKRTGQFLKQLTKKETKETKRENLLKQIHDTESHMNEELKRSRTFVSRQLLFDKRFMWGSKLGEAAPKQRALIVVEQSDKMTMFIDEVMDEITKLANNVINPPEKEDGTAVVTCDTIQMAVFNGSGVSIWFPGANFQKIDDPKKGLADSLKWLKKNFSKKNCEPQAWPPNYVTMFDKFTEEGVQPPWKIFLCVSCMPSGPGGSDTIEKIKELRESMDPPQKGQPTLPINVVAFDPTIKGDKDQEKFFTELAGPSGNFMVDTSQEDLVALGDMLKDVTKQNKTLAKFNKKLDKMEDLSADVAGDRELLQTQIALESMLTNDFEICTWAMAQDPPQNIPEI